MNNMEPQMDKGLGYSFTKPNSSPKKNLVCMGRSSACFDWEGAGNIKASRMSKKK